ncbi:MAG: carbonate dehydratase [Pseudomonadota bacterium]
MLEQLFQNNKRWAREITSRDPEFFNKLAKQQTPEYLWIGCADSRVPANEIVGLYPGELFVHRNVANIVLHMDINCLAVVQFAVEILKVKHIIVCGHYGCGGVRAALEGKPVSPLIDHWISPIYELYLSHHDEFDRLESPQAKFDRLCELNVIEQVHNLAQTYPIQKAWQNDQPLAIHGLIYRLDDGILKNLNVTLTRHNATTG